MKELSKNGFDDLIEAFRIFKKYNSGGYAPLHCEHDILTVVAVDPDVVSAEDKARLEELGFLVMNEYGEPNFSSFRFGSA